MKLLTAICCTFAVVPLAVAGVQDVKQWLDSDHASDGIGGASEHPNDPKICNGQFYDPSKVCKPAQEPTTSELMCP